RTVCQAHRQKHSQLFSAEERAAIQAGPRRRKPQAAAAASRMACKDRPPAEQSRTKDGIAMTAESPASVAAAYFDAWQRKDIEQVRPLLDNDVDFVGALGSTRGLDETLAGLRGMFAMTERIEV